MEMTIDQLAQRVSMSSRNIREWQRQGLLPPPTRRGRVGIYSDEHVARIRRVQQLHSEGFPLDLIRRMIDTGTGSESDIRHLAAEVLAPFSTAGPITVSRAELDKRLGAGAAAQLAKLGLIADTDGDPVSVRDAEALDLIEGLTGTGVSLERLVATLVDVRGHQRSIADVIAACLCRGRVGAVRVVEIRCARLGFAGRQCGARPATGERSADSSAARPRSTTPRHR